MHNSLLGNIQALNLLQNLETLSKLQFLYNRLPILPTIPSQSLLSLPPAQPFFSSQLPMPMLSLSKMLEFSNQNDLLTSSYRSSISNELMQPPLAKLSHLQPVTPHVTLQSVTNQSPKEVKTVSSTQPKAIQAAEVDLESQVKKILTYLVSNFGRVSQKELDRERQKYESDIRLIQVFDTLVSKYASTTKTKEEMIKYVLRKAIKSIKDKLKEGNKRNEKEVNKIFCQKYFSSLKEELLVKGCDIEDEEELLKLLLPFKKTSTNKTMNSSFLSKIFTSEEFCTDYEGYLSEFESEASYDNETKIKRFVSYITSCVKSKKTLNISNYKRVPWLNIWLTNTKNIGVELIKGKSTSQIKKKAKNGVSKAMSSLETSDSDCKLDTFSTPETSQD